MYIIHSRSIRRALPLAVLALLPAQAFACATCGCSLNIDAAAGYSSEPGWRINLDESFIDQDRLRHGSGSASPRDVVDDPMDPEEGGGEIEKRTINRYANLSVAYRPNADWGFTAILPWISRNHTTYGDQEAPFAPEEIASDQVSGVDLSGFGDMKVLASYQGFVATHNLGVQFGVKLPTGRYGGQNEETGEVAGDPVKFRSGPMAGDALDASLQAGTGSTDVIVGMYGYRAVSQNFDAYANLQYQAAVAQKLDRDGTDFRPGNQFNATIGIRYEANPRVVPQLQLNLVRKSRDTGALADTLDSAGTIAWLSPGVTVGLRDNVQAYAFAQLPVYSRLDGYQLFPRWTATVGFSVGF